MKILFIIVAVAVAMTSAPGEEPAITLKPYARPVITWVPPYQTARCQARLRESTLQPGPADVLTHVALQFWTPTADGAVKRATHYDRLTDDLIAGWRDWCHEHGLRALLCVYNGEEKWDWPLAQAAFTKNPEKFVAALVAELDLQRLDGIDIDLEGNGDFAADQAPFVAFVQQLSTALHARQKQLYVDTFAYKWNAPNQQWWPDLFPLVDGLTTMGYEETGSHSEGWRGYSAAISAAGKNAGKLLIGVPTHLDRWQENTALEHLAWIATTAKAPGVALWDAQFKGDIWRDTAPWSLLQKVRGK